MCGPIASPRRCLTLLPSELLVKTGPVDHADWNYHGMVARLQQHRFRMALAALGKRRYGRLLELGYGSGIFMPELSQRCDALYGLDIHAFTSEVAAALARVGVTAELTTGRAERLPYPSGYFDAVVSISALEFVPEVEVACREIGRLLAPGGVFVVVTPAYSPVVDWGLKLLTGESAKQDFGNRRKRVHAALRRTFRVLSYQVFPPIWAGVQLYHVFELDTAK